MIENHVIAGLSTRPDRSEGTSARAYLTVKPKKLEAVSRAQAHARTRAREIGRGGVTIPGDPASGTGQGKSTISPRRSP
jgi:hypothetical protein